MSDLGLVELATKLTKPIQVRRVVIFSIIDAKKPAIAKPIMP